MAGTTTTFGIGLEVALEAVAELAPRVARLIRSVRDPGAHAVGHWTVGDVAAHLSHVCALEVGAAKELPFEEMPEELSRKIGVAPLGEGEELPPLPEGFEGVAAMNDFALSRDPVRDPRTLADRIERSVGEFIALGRSIGEDRVVPWLLETRLPLSGLAGHLLFEMSLHGDDVAKGSRQRWHIDPVHACIAIEAFLLRLMPQVMGGSGGESRERGSCEMRLRGGPRFVFVGYEDGRVSVESPDGRRPDLYISAEPATALLVMSGRRGRLGASLRGRMLAWGRHPLRAIRTLETMQPKV